MIEMKPVDQPSNIRESGYDPQNSIMRVRFKGGQLYEYVGVTAEMNDAFWAAPSKGSYHARIIKVGCPASLVDERAPEEMLPEVPDDSIFDSFI